MKELLEIAFPGKFEVSRVHGGDINESFLIKHRGKEFFIKYNGAPTASEMFSTETKGLLALSKVVPGITPKVINQIDGNTGSLLILEYLSPGSSRQVSQISLGRSLASIHSSQSKSFGLGYTNYIGSLKQENGWFDNFSSFYISARLEPQLCLAYDNGLIGSQYLSYFDNLGTIINDEVPPEPACLIHGDLWGGNHLLSTDGKYYLIDPSISYAHREIDLAMTRLFGG